MTHLRLRSLVIGAWLALLCACGKSPPGPPAPGCGALTKCGAACVDLTSNPLHCGGCGFVCAPDERCDASRCIPYVSPCDGGACSGSCGADADCGAGGTCDGGACGCAAGFHTCGHSCVESAHVETCGARCAPCDPPPNGSPTCDAGACDFFCEAGFHRCGFACVSDTSVTACGAACRTCPSPPDPASVAACVNDSCTVACRAGARPCSNANGACVFETAASCGASCAACAAQRANAIATCESGVCSDRCAPGTNDCGGICVVETIASCGPSCTACSTPANGTTGCDAGLCTETCNAGFHFCNGQCVVEDANSCGPQCQPCAMSANATASCVHESCQSACNTGFHDCVGACVAEDSTSCGAACAACPPPPIDGGMACVSEVCVAQCTAGQHLCSNACVDENVNSCGLGCKVCPASPDAGVSSCTAGACVISCDPGFIRCGQGCCRAIDITAGYWSACALTSSGELRCWGTGALGYPGMDYVATSTVPLNPELDAGFRGVTCDSYATCALTTGGAPYCWGEDYSGELGNGPTGYNEVTPGSVMGLTGADQVVLGGEFALALVDGGVWGWGLNYNQEVLGINTTYAFDAPIALSLPTQMAALTAGLNFACALTTTGAVQCWGGNDTGQIGNSASSQFVYPPSAVALPAVAVQVSAHDNGKTACAVLSSGAIYCWGDNSSGQLGTGTAMSSGTPQAVVGIADAGSISVGATHVCTLIGGQPWCWGDNSSGQLGDGTTQSRFLAVPVLGLDAGVARVACGNGFTCVLMADGSVECWGSNLHGQLGNGTLDSGMLPGLVSGAGP